MYAAGQMVVRISARSSHRGRKKYSVVDQAPDGRVICEGVDGRKGPYKIKEEELIAIPSKEDCINLIRALSHAEEAGGLESLPDVVDSDKWLKILKPRFEPKHGNWRAMPLVQETIGKTYADMGFGDISIGQPKIEVFKAAREGIWPDRAVQAFAAAAACGCQYKYISRVIGKSDDYLSRVINLYIAQPPGQDLIERLEKAVRDEIALPEITIRKLQRMGKLPHTL